MVVQLSLCDIAPYFDPADAFSLHGQQNLADLVDDGLYNSTVNWGLRGSNLISRQLRCVDPGYGNGVLAQLLPW